MHSEEGRRAAALQRHAGTTEIESIRDASRKEIGTIAKHQLELVYKTLDLGIAIEIPQQVRRHGLAREHADHAGKHVGHCSGILKRLPCALKEEPVLGIHQRRVPRRDPEESSVE